MSTLAARPRKRGRSLKIVVTGPFGAGKTSLISTISEIDVLSTERSVTDGPVAEKSSTTVAMDFGRLTIDDELALYLFGTPGQRRFDFMWEILAEGMLGFVVMVDAGRDDSIHEAREILEFFVSTADVPFVVAVNKAEADPDAAVASARRELDVPDDVRVVACRALDRDSVKGVIVELLHAVLDDVERHERAAV